MEKGIGSLKVQLEEKSTKMKCKEETPIKEEGIPKAFEWLTGTKPFYSPKFSLMDQLKELQR